MQKDVVNEMHPTTDLQQRPTADASLPNGPRMIRSCDLFRGAREVRIQHGTETYRLRLTRAGKLILNK